jgi:hypothetical protein
MQKSFFRIEAMGGIPINATVLTLNIYASQLS